MSIIEQLPGALAPIVSARLGRPWSAGQVRDLRDLACHPCAILSDGEAAVFVKFSEAEDAREQFEIELSGLAALSRLAGVRTPTPVGVFAIDGGTVLVQEALDEVERAAESWRDIGRTLGRIHAVKGVQFGWERRGYFGPLPQDNRPAGDWPTFFADRRLRPMLALVAATGQLPTTLATQIERLIARVPELCGPAVQPTLLHGDAQKNNFVSTPTGAVVIDPAVQYGHPELDLAFVDYFEPVPADVFAGYREEQAIDDGFWERRELWRLWGYLAAVAVEGGPVYLERVERAVATYA